MGWLKDLVFGLLRIKPARERSVIVREPLTFRANVMKNRLWYRGEPAELEQFFRQTASCGAELARFWAAAPQGRVRKLHSGIVGSVVDRYRDIVVTDFDGLSFGETGREHPLADRWGAIAADSDLHTLLGEAVSGALVSGDGAFKITVEPERKTPVITFYEADRVEFVREGGRLAEVRFFTGYEEPDGEYLLEERYGPGYVRYRLTDGEGRETPLDRLSAAAFLTDAEFDGDFIMAVPLILFGPGKWPGRGKALFDGKTDVLDALDEVISQWLDAVRMGRIKRYIPEDLIPRDPETGAITQPNAFDNDYIAVGSVRSEGVREQIEISQPDISYDAYLTSYCAFLDMALQGIMSPATLGIDLKKRDNAEAQREKEHITMHVRGRIVDALGRTLAALAETALRVEDLMAGKEPGEYRASARFGEYASPDFGTTVEIVAKARAAGIMSVEQSVEELYGDSWTAEEKAAECARLREEPGLSAAPRRDAGINTTDRKEKT